MSADRDTSSWETASTLDEVAVICADHRRSGVAGDIDGFSMTQRLGCLGPISVVDLIFGSELWMDCGAERTTYNIVLPLDNHIKGLHRGAELTAAPRSPTVVLPQGETLFSRLAGRCLVLRLDRHTVDDALTEMLGRQVDSPIGFSSAADDSPATSAWTDMALMLSTNAGRFSAAHSARYGQPPSMTLRR